MLDKFPSIKFEGEELVISSNDNEIKCLSSEIIKITYSYIDPSYINSISFSDNTFCLDGNLLRVKGIAPCSYVYVYKTDGCLISKTRTDDKGNAIIAFTPSSKELYIVKTAVANFKISLK